MEPQQLHRTWTDPVPPSTADSRPLPMCIGLSDSPRQPNVLSCVDRPLHARALPWPVAAEGCGDWAVLTSRCRFSPHYVPFKIVRTTRLHLVGIGPTNPCELSGVTSNLELKF